MMSTRIVTVEMDDKLSVVKDIFDHLRFHHVLVVEYKKLVGVVSDRDLLKVISPKLGTRVETTKDVATLGKRVHQIMTRKPITLRPEDSIRDAVQLITTQNISCIPIVDGEFRPVGIVSWRDLLKSLVTER